MPRNKEAKTFEAAIRDYILPGTTIWTDGHPSYKWLDDSTDFMHESVNHHKREFARLRADRVNISTNAIEVEGLFAHLKRDYRAVPRAPDLYQ